MSTLSTSKKPMALDLPYLFVLLFVVVSALGAVLVPGYITSVIVLSVFSILTTVAFAMAQAVDVAMAEAVIGAGLMTAIFVTAVDRMRRKR